MAISRRIFCESGCGSLSSPDTSREMSKSPSVYAMHIDSRESFVSANAPAVDLDDNSQHQTLLATTEHVINLSDGESRSFPVQVEYQFGGVYQQQELPVIECGGAIELKR